MSHEIEEDDFQGKFDPKLWRRIAGHLKPFRKRVFYMVLAGLVLAVVDVLFPYITGKILDSATANSDDIDSVLRLGAIYAGLCVLFCVLVWFFIDQAGHLATGLAYNIRKRGFTRLQELDFSYFDRRPVGWLVSRLTSDCSKISDLMPWLFLDLAWGSIFIIGIAVAMLLLHWQLGLIVLIIVPFLIWSSYYFQSRLLESSRRVRKTNSKVTASFNECLAGVRTTKSLVREERNLLEFQNLSGEMKKYSMRNTLQSAAFLPLVTSIGSIGVGLALWHGGKDFLSNTGFTLGTLVIFMQYAGLIYMPIRELATRFTELQGAQAAAERIQFLLETEPKIIDSEEVKKRITADGDGYEDEIETIEYRNVSFSYDTGETVLEDFNLTVKAGQTIALVGATGGGKSTIVNLLGRFYEPVSGEILINDRDYRERGLAWYQSKLGVVLQTPYLFSGSVRDNIAYGRPEASDEQVIEAAKVVNAHDFISKLENGYDTPAGEGGSLFSTGQRQLVALARAVLADPQIFILDEATSSIDTETEQLIQEGIDAALSDRTAFVIAHRLSTIRNADVILVIEHGKIVEKGSHAELMKADGQYANLYRNQYAEAAVG